MALAHLTQVQNLKNRPDNEVYFVYDLKTMILTDELDLQSNNNEIIHIQTHSYVHPISQTTTMDIIHIKNNQKRKFYTYNEPELFSFLGFPSPQYLHHMEDSSAKALR